MTNEVYKKNIFNKNFNKYFNYINKKMRKEFVFKI